jgi:hypothetical protein
MFSPNLGFELIPSCGAPEELVDSALLSVQNCLPSEAPSNDFGFLLQGHNADPKREPPGECSGPRRLPCQQQTPVRRRSAWESEGLSGLIFGECRVSHAFGSRA